MSLKTVVSSIMEDFHSDLSEDNIAFRIESAIDSYVKFRIKDIYRGNKNFLSFIDEPCNRLLRAVLVELLLSLDLRLIDDSGCYVDSVLMKLGFKYYTDTDMRYNTITLEGVPLCRFEIQIGNNNGFEFIKL